MNTAPETLTPAPSVPAGAFAPRLAAFAARRGLDETRTAEALGVPLFTARKWANGTRTPSASAVRLLDVLEALEALAPAILDALTPAPAPAASKRPRGRPKATPVKAPNQTTV